MADTQTNVAYARSNLEQYVPSGTTEFLEKLNFVTNRLTTSGKWRGSFVSIVLTADENGIITLPARFLSILSAKYDYWPTQVLSQWFDYMTVGLCDADEANSWPFGPIVDLGDGFATQFVQEDTGLLKVYSALADNAKIVRIYGIDSATGEPVIDSNGVEGEQIALATPSVTTTHSFSSVTGFQKVLTKSPVTLKVIPSGGGSEVTLSVFQSWEQFPSYHRYRCGTSSGNVKIFAQRRFIPMISEFDWVIPGDLHALKQGLRAMAYEDSGDDGKASHAWNSAYAALNAEAKSLRGGGQIPIPTNVWGWGQNVPTTN